MLGRARSLSQARGAIEASSILPKRWLCPRISGDSFGRSLVQSKWLNIMAGNGDSSPIRWI